MTWSTLRNPNIGTTITTDGRYVVVPVQESDPVKGWAVVDTAQLTPTFKTQKEAQAWAERQR